MPPAYSAKKVEGEAAHRRVRRGEAVTLEPARVVVHELELLGWTPPRVTFRVVCSTGTYIRAIARDVGDALGVGAHLTALRRTRVGGHTVDDAVSGDFPESIPETAWRTPLQALGDWPRIAVEEAIATRITHGQRIPVDHPDEENVTVSWGEELLAVARVTDGVLRPAKVFPDVLEPTS